MRIGASLLLIAIGAILKFAVTDTLKNVDLGVIGVILIVVGIVGVLAELILWSTHRRTTVVSDDPYADEVVARRRRY